MLKRKTNRKLSEFQAYAIGLAVSVIVMLTMLVLCTVFIVNEYFVGEMFGPLAVVIQLLSCCLGGVMAGALSNEAKKKAYIVIGVALLILELATALVVFEGVSGMYLWLLLATATSCAGGIFVSTSKEKRSNVRHRSKRLT